MLSKKRTLTKKKDQKSPMKENKIKGTQKTKNLKVSNKKEEKNNKKWTDSSNKNDINNGNGKQKEKKKQKDKQKEKDKENKKNETKKKNKREQKYDCSKGICVLTPEELARRNKRTKALTITPGTDLMKVHTSFDKKNKEGEQHLSINPKLWGKYAWLFLDGICVLFPNFDGKKWCQLIITFSDLIPCGSCEMAFKQHLRDKPLTSYWLCGPARLSMWINNAHNEVNLRNDCKIWKYCDHRDAIQSITPGQWLEATFKTLFFLVQFEALKREVLFDFMSQLSALCRENKIHPLINKFGYLLQNNVLPQYPLLSCKAPCLQESIMIIEEELNKE